MKKFKVIMFGVIIFFCYTLTIFAACKDYIRVAVNGSEAEYLLKQCNSHSENGNKCIGIKTALAGTGKYSISCTSTKSNSNSNGAPATGYYKCGGICIWYNKGATMNWSCNKKVYPDLSTCTNNNSNSPAQNNAQNNVQNNAQNNAQNNVQNNTQSNSSGNNNYISFEQQCKNNGNYYNTDTSKAPVGCYSLSEDNCKTFGFTWTNGKCITESKNTNTNNSNSLRVLFDAANGYGLECRGEISTGIGLTYHGDGICIANVKKGTEIKFPETSEKIYSDPGYLVGWTNKVSNGKVMCTNGDVKLYNGTYEVNESTDFYACFEEIVNTNRYALKDASADGKEVPCGAALDITTCYRTSDTSIKSHLCKYKAINGDTSKQGIVYRNSIQPGEVKKSVCDDELSNDKENIEYKNEVKYALMGASADGQKVKCGSELNVTFCYTDKEGNLLCEYNSLNGDNTKTGVVNRGKIANEPPATTACTDGEEKVLTEKKCDKNYNQEKKNISGDYTFEMCYEKDWSEEKVNEEIEDIISCKNERKLDSKKTIPSEDVICNDYICLREYTVSCVPKNGSSKPTLSVTSAIVNREKGDIKVKANSKNSNIVAYHYSEIYKEPTSRSVWHKVDSNSFTISHTPGVIYIWVKDENGNISNAVSGAVIDTVNKDTSLKSLKVYDENGKIQTPSSVAYKVDGVVSGEYVKLSNNLNKDSKIAENGFNPFDTEYKMTVTSSKISVYATLTSTDSRYVPGYEPRTVNLDYGMNTILIKIENKEGKLRTYTILVERVDDRTSDNTLKDLKVSVGNINFDPYTTEYKVEIPKNTKNVDVKSTVSSENAEYIEGYEPGNVIINEDTTIKLIKVKSETGSTRTYVITFIKEGTDLIEKDSLRLFDLNISNVNIPFEESVANYSVTVDYSVDVIDIVAALKEEKSSVIYRTKNKVNAEYIEGSNKGIVLEVGENFIDIEVIDKNGDSAHYKITIIRKEFGLEVSNDITLKDLRVLGYKIDFKPTKKDYVVRIKQEKTLVITAIPNSNRSDVFIRGNEELTGFSTVRIKVVAENGEYETYSVDIRKDAFNKTIEIIAIISGILIILVSGGIIVINKKNKNRKDYYKE